MTLCAMEMDGGEPAQMLQGFQLLHGTLQLPDVGFQTVGNELCHIVRNVQIQQFCLAADDGDAGFKVRCADVGDQAPLEPAADPFFQRFQLLGRLIRSDHDLLALSVELVERVEEFLLHAFLVAEKLNVVDQQHVGVPVLVVEPSHVVVVDAGEEVVAEFFTGDVNDLVFRVIFRAPRLAMACIR